MKRISKNDLVDGTYYEGLASGESAVSKWDAKLNMFLLVDHSWHGTFDVPLNHPDDENEYFNVFHALSVADPKIVGQ